MRTIIVLDLVPLKLVAACLPLRLQDNHLVMAGGRNDPAIFDISESRDTVSMATHTVR